MWSPAALTALRSLHSEITSLREDVQALRTQVSAWDEALGEQDSSSGDEEYDDEEESSSGDEEYEEFEEDSSEQDEAPDSPCSSRSAPATVSYKRDYSLKQLWREDLPRRYPNIFPVNIA